jgi:hypothetical protein
MPPPPGRLAEHAAGDRHRPADAVDAGLRRGDAAVGIPGHRVVGQPDPGRRLPGAIGQVNAPDQAGRAVGDRQHAGAEQAGSVQRADPVIEGVNDLRRHRVTGCPAGKVEARQVRPSVTR